MLRLYHGVKARTLCGTCLPPADPWLRYAWPDCADQITANTITSSYYLRVARHLPVAWWLVASTVRPQVQDACLRLCPAITAFIWVQLGSVQGNVPRPGYPRQTLEFDNSINDHASSQFPLPVLNNTECILIDFNCSHVKFHPVELFQCPDRGVAPSKTNSRWNRIRISGQAGAGLI